MFSLISRPLNERLARCEKALSLRFLGINPREARKLRRGKLAEGCNQENRKCHSFHFPSDLAAKKKSSLSNPEPWVKKNLFFWEMPRFLPPIPSAGGAIGGKMESGLGERERERDSIAAALRSYFLLRRRKNIFHFPPFLGAHCDKGPPEIAPRDMPTPQWKNIFFT